MAGRRRMIYGSAVGSNFNTVLLQNQRPPSSSSASLFLPASSPFVGSRSMVSFEDVNGRNFSDRSFFQPFDQDENGDEDFDEYFHQPEKKRRLKAEQIQYLEKCFEVENKLEPERKVQLAKDLGLQPRQVAIWFQNRRARWKTKSLEKDYEILQDNYNSIKTDYDNLLKEKEKLKSEVLELTDKLLIKEREKNGLKILNKQTLIETLQQDYPLNDPSKNEVLTDSIVACKKEDLNSVNSDEFDSNSPNYTDGVHSSLLEPYDSSYPDQSDMSQDEEDNSRTRLLPSLAHIFPVAINSYCPELPANSWNFGLPIEEDHSFGFWAC